MRGSYATRAPCAGLEEVAGTARALLRTVGRATRAPRNTMPTTIRWIAFALVALATACGGASANAPRASLEPGETCPAGLPGLAVRTMDIDGGGAFVMTARSDQVDELRVRMHRFVRISNAALRESGAEDPWLHRSSLGAVDVPGGVRVDARPLNEGRARDLRAELRRDAVDLNSGRCPLALTMGD